MIGLVLLGPVLLVAMGLLLVINGRPICFTQIRIGRGNQPFTVIKLRTLRPPNSRNESDAARISPLGRILRATSIDELPQLMNVLNGEMSLVGPRPLLPEYLSHYTGQQVRRHEVLPGITGWAQVHGRNALDWKTRFELDVYYVDNASLKLDLTIIWRTIGIVLGGKGISQPGHATAERFRGEHE